MLRQEHFLCSLPGQLQSKSGLGALGLHSPRWPCTNLHIDIDSYEHYSDHFNCYLVHFDHHHDDSSDNSILFFGRPKGFV